MSGCFSFGDERADQPPIAGGISISPSGDMVFAGVREGSTWYVASVDVESGARERLVEVVEGMPTNIAYVPDSRELYFAVTRHGTEGLESSVWRLFLSDQRMEILTGWGGIIEELDAHTGGTVVFTRGSLEDWGWLELGARDADVYWIPGSGAGEQRITYWAAWSIETLSLGSRASFAYLNANPGCLGGDAARCPEEPLDSGSRATPPDGGAKLDLHTGTWTVHTVGECLTHGGQTFAGIPYRQGSSWLAWKYVDAAEFTLVTHAPRQALETCMSDDGKTFVVYSAFQDSDIARLWVARAPGFEPEVLFDPGA